MNALENTTQTIDLNAEAAKILREMRMPKSVKGYEYLCTAISLVANGFNIIDEGLYTYLAEKYETTTNGAESAIRRAIGIAWDIGDVDILNSYFGYTIDNCRGKPTSSEFIAQIADHISLNIENDPLKTKFSDALRQMGVPADIMGHRYLRTALLFVIRDPDIINSVDTVLYPYIAEKYQTTTSRVESAIRKAIEISWDRGDLDTLNAYFGYTITRGIPTPSEFIAVVADNLKQK